MKLLLLLIVTNFIADQVLQLKMVRQEKHKDSALFMVYIFTWLVPMFIFTCVMVFVTEDVWFLKFVMTLTAIKIVVGWCCLRMWTNLWYQRKRSMMAFWINFEQAVMTLFIIGLLNYFIV